MIHPTHHPMAMSTVELVAYLEENLEVDYTLGVGKTVLPKAARAAIRRILREEHDTRMAYEASGSTSMKNVNQGLRMALRHLAMIYSEERG